MQDLQRLRIVNAFIYLIFSQFIEYDKFSDFVIFLLSCFIIVAKVLYAVDLIENPYQKSQDPTQGKYSKKFYGLVSYEIVFASCDLMVTI